MKAKKQISKERRTPEESLYYLLATVYGEQDRLHSFDGRYEPRNRRIWNALMGRAISQRAKQNFANALGIDVAEFEPLMPIELRSIEERLAGTRFSIDDIPTDETIHQFFEIGFRNITFEKPLLMSQRLFPSSTSFTDCEFRDNFSVQRSIFVSAHFHRSRFRRHAYFRETEIGTIGMISNACEVIDCRFAMPAVFSKAKLRNADFSRSKFRSAADFEETVFFDGCPKFFEASLSENTIFSHGSRNWSLPSPRVDRQGILETFTENMINREAVKFSALRKRMEEIGRPVDVGFFTRKELELRAELKGVNALLIRAYGAFSGFGHSIERPLAALSLSILFGFLIYGGYFSQGELSTSVAETPYTSGLGLSVSSTFSFLGLGRLFYSETLSVSPSPIAFVYGVQSVLGFVFSFLMGLGIRNRLRLS